ncbi:MAG: DMT family transporter [Candidatus Eisenbacteria bacterium]|jgi:drug/metabolite transporter (DMT)-like permease|nr:DMT family transporter [Candidatus Eisenbacteria bacterium]
MQAQRGPAIKSLRRAPIPAEALLLLTAMVWGVAFVAQRAGMAYLGPFTFNGLRFALGALAVTPLARREVSPREHASRAATAPRIAFTGAALFLGASCQQAGLVYTSAGKAGFITGLYVVLVPLMGVLLTQTIGLLTWCGALLAAAGLYLLSVTESFHVAPGDGLVFLGAIFWAIHVHAVGRYAPAIGPLRLARWQFTLCAAASLAVAAVTETPTASAIGFAAIPLLYAGIVSVGLGYTLQVVAQQRSAPSRAAIILSLESVFASAGGVLVLGESLSVREIVGCATMLAGMLCAQIPPRHRGRHPLGDKSTGEEAREAQSAQSGSLPLRRGGRTLP